MAETKTADKSRFREVLAALERTYGKVQALPEEPPLDHAIYLLLRENWDYRKAQRALRLLQKEFVDWNEVRVSTRGELHSLLAPLGDKDVDVKIEKLKTLLELLYREESCAHMNFLLERDAAWQARFLAGTGVLTPAQVQLLVYSLHRDGDWEVPEQAIRVLSRIGLLPRVYSMNSARKHVEALIGAEDVCGFHAWLVQHGEEICTLKSPRCGECSLVTLCGYKRKVGVVPKA